MKTDFWNDHLHDGKKIREGFYIEARDDGTYYLGYLYIKDIGYHVTPIDKASYEVLLNFIKQKK